MQWEINRREVRRYFGYGNQEADEKVDRVIEDSIVLLKGAVHPRAVYQVYPLKMSGRPLFGFDSILC